MAILLIFSTSSGNVCRYTSLSTLSLSQPPDCIKHQESREHAAQMHYNAESMKLNI